jgi:hypothetical protein
MSVKTFFRGFILAGAMLWLLSCFDQAFAWQGGLGYEVSYGIPNQINLGLYTNSRSAGPCFYKTGRYIVDNDVATPLFISALIEDGKIGFSFYSVVDFVLLPVSNYLGGLYKNPAGALPWDDFLISFLLLNSRTSVYYRGLSCDYGLFVERGWQGYLFSEDQYDSFVHELGLGATLDCRVIIARLGVFHDHFFNDGHNKYFLKLDVARSFGL